MNKKSLITIGIILGLAIIVGGFWYVQNNKNNNQGIVNNEQEKVEVVEEIDTSDWKTYRNEEYGFEVKYPKDWKVSESKNGYITIDGKTSECALVPEGCPIIALYDEYKHFNSDYISIRVVEEFLQNMDDDVSQKTQWWTDGMHHGCFVTANKILDENKFLFLSFYEATDLDNDDSQTRIDMTVCENNNLSPFFDEILLSFTPIK